MTYKEVVLLSVYSITMVIVLRPLFPNNLEYFLAAMSSGVLYGYVSWLVKR
jgi:hypothetical protein